MITDAEMYAEVFDLLKYMNKQTVMKIPVEYLEYIKKEKSDTYVTRVNKNDIDNPNNVDQRTINLFTWLTVNYFSTEDEKKEILKLATENEYKNKFDEDAYNRIFEKAQKVEITNDDKIEKPVVIKEGIFSKIKKIISFIKSIFN
ncbi:MAG: hypothetical protein IJW20_03675 [Clostridia bacterium]|nr:hypothetical protein [Clostridia bacterium]